MNFDIVLPYLEALEAIPGGKLAASIILFAFVSIVIQISLMIVLRTAKFLVGKTETSLDDRILHVIKGFLPWIAVITSVWISLEAVYPDLLVGNFTELDIYIILMLATAGFLLSSLADQILLWYGLEIRPRKKDIKDEDVFPFVRNVIKIAIILVFAVFVMQRMGFDTTAIITGLGVGTLAVALALQDTLANFFAGVHILVDKPFREDDYIKLADGSAEGIVDEIGWRTTRLITPTMNELVVPNSKLAGSIVENFSNPKGHSGVSYSVGVDYKEDVNEVEKVISECLANVAKKDERIRPESIWVRFDSFGEYALNFKFGYEVNGYASRNLILKEVNKELFYAFKQHKINVPFPVMIVQQKK
jgi:small-conductance mechanosensitive channel